ncbi:MAG: transcription antitermination factor NusB [Candidatus Kryptoniota bacterium]
MPTQRRVARERVLQALYAYDLSGSDPEFLSNEIFQDIDDEMSLEFARKLYRDTLEHLGEIDALIQRHLEHWDVSRVNPVDRNILRMGISELLFFKEVPTKVTINEAIEISKKYSTEESPKFVNGILDAALKLLTREKRIIKEGRGLIDQTTRKKK